MRTIVAVTMAAVLAASGFTQEGPKPGPEHQVLKKMVGTWDTTMKFGDMEAKGQMTYKMDLGGLWLIGNLESQMAGQKFSGRSLDGFDPNKKKYVGVWVDSMSTSPLVVEGTFDKAKKTFTWAGEGPGMDGKPTKYRIVSHWQDDDTMVSTMSMGGDGQEQSFTITYKRKK
jgi:hypothetical protein